MKTGCRLVPRMSHQACLPPRRSPLPRDLSPDTRMIQSAAASPPRIFCSAVVGAFGVSVRRRWAPVIPGNDGNLARSGLRFGAKRRLGPIAGETPSVSMNCATPRRCVEDPALTPHHVRMVRHHLRGPGRRIVQAGQVMGRGQGPYDSSSYRTRSLRLHPHSPIVIPAESRECSSARGNARANASPRTRTGDLEPCPPHGNGG